MLTRTLSPSSLNCALAYAKRRWRRRRRWPTRKRLAHCMTGIKCGAADTNALLALSPPRSARQHLRQDRETAMSAPWEMKQDPEDGSWEVGFIRDGKHVLLAYGLSRETAMLIVSAPLMRDALTQLVGWAEECGSSHD